VQGGVAQAAASTRKFDFDGSFGGSSTQADVFSDVGAPVVRAVLQGYHGCIFAYGQTGSGKTFSLLNAGTPGRNFEDAGLLPRLVATLYVRAGQDAAHQYAVECGAFQVYNEQVADLLHPEHRNGKGQNLSVSKKDGHGQVDNLTWKACASAKELLDHFAYARKNVIYAETKMNKASSRSHACFQLRVTRREKNSNKGSVSLCSVVDLAGSERVKRSGVAGKELKEAININGSLLALGNVVAALAAKKKHVPYRDSKLTRVLEGSVGGNCRTTLFLRKSCRR
jgi:kinesin family protein 5